MTLRTLRSLLGAATFAALAAATSAAAQTATFQVSASVARVCTIAATNVAFGAYDPVVANAATPATATGTVTVRCTRGETYRVSLDNGVNFSSGRRMKHATANEYLPYELYSDSGYTVVWNTTNQVPGTAASRAPVDLTVYARVPGGEDVPVGAYTDSVVADIHL